MKEDAQKKTYIIIRLSALGDVSMTLPYIYNIAKGHPHDLFVFVTQPFMSGLFLEAPKNVVIERLDKGKVRNIMQLMSFARQLHFAYRKAVVIDLHDVIRTKIMLSVMKLYGHKTYRLRKPRMARKKLTSRSNGTVVSPQLYLPKMTDLYEHLIRKAGLTFCDPIQTILPRQETLDRITIGVAPHAQHRGKRISKEQTIELIDALLKTFPKGQIILYGAPGSETEQNREIIQRCGSSVVRLTEGASLKEEIEEIARLHCMVSMDSANQHIAAMVGTPVISIWGATHPAGGFLPFGIDESQCYGIELDCRPCSIFGNKPCHRGDWACLEQMNMEEVAKKVSLLIGGDKIIAE